MVGTQRKDVLFLNQYPSQYGGRGGKHVTVELGPRQAFAATQNGCINLVLDFGAMVPGTCNYLCKGTHFLSETVLLHIIRTLIQEEVDCE